MKKRILSIMAGALVFVSLSTTAFAANTTSNRKAKIGDPMTNKQVEISKNFLKQHPDLVKMYKDAGQQKQNGLLKGPAAPLTSYYVYFVADSTDGNGNYTGEQISRNQLSTRYDHNGTIYVLVVEIGYGRESATFNGTQLKEYDDVMLDFDGDRIIDGFIDIWKIDGVTSGQFSSTATSTNFNPNHTAPFYAGINIL
jgi:hypothetical protein